MSTDTKRLRDLAVRSNDGVLRGPALEAADEIDRLRADAEESGRALILAGRVNKKLTDEAMGLVADNKRLREALRGLALNLVSLRNGAEFDLGESSLDLDQGKLLAYTECAEMARAALQGESHASDPA